MRKEKKPNRAFAIAALVFIALMVLSGVGVYWTEDTSTQRYAGHKFELTNQGWLLRVNDNNYYFEYLPQETFNLNVPREIFLALAQAPVFVMTSYYNDTYQGEIAAMQFKVLEVLAQQQKYAGLGFVDYAAPQIPQLSCTNATSSMPIIQFQEANVTSTSAQGACLIVEFSSSYDVGLFRDRLVYELLGVPVTSP